MADNYSQNSRRRRKVRFFEENLRKTKEKWKDMSGE